MDDDNAIEVSGDYAASTPMAALAAAELQTPQMPPSWGIPWRRMMRFRKEIKQGESTIASTEAHIIFLQESIKLRSDELTAASGNIALIELITALTREISLAREQLGWDMQRLAQLEEKLQRAEEEVEKSARGMSCNMLSIISSPM
jgi:hypothetical protein